MADDIHVVRVTPRGEPGLGWWRVHFSRAVRFQNYPGAGDSWDVEDDRGDWLVTDELGAFRWGLKVIEEHHKKEQANG